MNSPSDVVSQHLLIVFFVYGLAFFSFGTTILLKSNTRSPLELRKLLSWLAGFALLHGINEWSDMFLQLGEIYWTPQIFRGIKFLGFYFGLSSFIFLLTFGVKSVALDRPRLKWVGRAVLTTYLLVVPLVLAWQIQGNLSNQWYAVAGVLVRYLVAFPASLLAAAELLRRSRSPEIEALGSSALVRSIRTLAAVFAVYGLLAGAIVPKVTFPPASLINDVAFHNLFGFPVQFFRAACAVLAAFILNRLLNAFSAATYRNLDEQIEARTSELADVNAALLADLAARREVEAQLEQSRDAALASSKAKSEFLANMSHEIRTPMNGITGMTELVLDTQLDSEQREHLDMVKSSAESLLSIINDILDYSKIEAGKLEIDAIDFSLHDSIGDTLKTMALRAHRKGLELAYDLEPDVPDALVGDPGRLRQVIVNLVGNAIKFTQHGEVVLYVQTVKKSSDSIELQFTISDTGIGIPAEKQGAIFEAFTQADGSTTRAYGGTGLGLTISTRLIQLMGGRIWVESELNSGSRFHFSAHFGLRKAAARTIVPCEPAALYNVRVLVVEDNETNRRLLLKVLTNWHMNPTAVESGARAIAILNEEQGAERFFRLILLDAQMPEMDGFALADRIRRSPQWRDVPMMMLSSAAQRGDAKRCRELGIAALLPKPLRRKELLEAILNVLRSKETKENQPPLITRHSLRENKPHVASADISAPSGKGLHILLAEDNPVNQRLAVSLLKKRGHTVTVAGNGREVLAALQVATLHLVFMDVQMPEMDGLQATAAIRKNEESSGNHLPIIAMTAHAMKGDQERCLAAGMDGYLSKPIKPQELDEILQKYVARRMEMATVGGGVTPSE